MGKQDKRERNEPQAGLMARELECSYKGTRTLRRRLQRLVEQANLVDEGWIELVADVESVEARLHAAVNALERIFDHPPGVRDLPLAETVGDHTEMRLC